MAEEVLQEVLTDARRGELDAPVSTGATFADASAEWLRHAAQERACKASTLTDYRLTVRRLDEALGAFTLEDITTATIERWRDDWIARESPSNRTVQKYLVILGSIFRIRREIRPVPHAASSTLVPGRSTRRRSF